MMATQSQAIETLKTFQARLERRGLLQEHETAGLLSVALVDRHWPPNIARPIDHWIRSSANDTPEHQRHRVTVLRLASMAAKWFTLLAPRDGSRADSALWSRPPEVAVSPDPAAARWRHTLTACWRMPGLSGEPQREVALWVSDAPWETSPKASFAFLGDPEARDPRQVPSTASTTRARHWVIPQGGSSAYWVAEGLWHKQARQASVTQWLRSPIDRRTWLQTLETLDDVRRAGLIAFPVEEKLMSRSPFVPGTRDRIVDPEQADLLRSQVGACAWWEGRSSLPREDSSGDHEKIYMVLPEFWDRFALHDILKTFYHQRARRKTPPPPQKNFRDVVRDFQKSAYAGPPTPPEAEREE